MSDAEHGWDDDDDDGFDDGGDGDWGDFEDIEEDQQGGVGEDDVLVQIDNLFYEAEDNRRKAPAAALEQFERCLAMEKKAGPTFIKRFKALEHIVSLNLVLGRTTEMIRRFEELMTMSTDMQVTSNDRSAAINSILNAVAESGNPEFIVELFTVARNQLKKLPNQERLYFTISIKLCRNLLEQGDLDRVEDLLRELHRLCQLPDGQDDRSKGSELLEVYALKVQYLAAQGDSVQLKELFVKTKDLSAEIKDPRSMSIIQECWGKSYASEGLWDQAYTEFWDAFLQYQQIGHERARSCLKYVVMANMLSSGRMNPFDATEAKVYQRDPEIEAFMSLRDAFDNIDIQKFQSLLRTDYKQIVSDSFIEKNVDSLLYELRSRALVRIIKPYRRLNLSTLAAKLDSTVEAVEDLAVQLILDGSVHGRIDQVHGWLDLSHSAVEVRFEPLSRWASNLRAISDAVANATSITTAPPVSQHHLWGP